MQVCPKSRKYHKVTGPNNQRRLLTTLVQLLSYVLSYKFMKVCLPLLNPSVVGDAQPLTVLLNKMQKER